MNFENISVKVDKPYPEIVGATEDAVTVNVLKNLASSRVGELSGILQYIYQSVVADKTNQDIASILEEIGICIAKIKSCAKYQNNNFYSECDTLYVLLNNMQDEEKFPFLGVF